MTPFEWLLAFAGFGWFLVLLRLLTGRKGPK
jgi:hypothetical protein